MKKLFLVFLFLYVSTSSLLYSQDTLPNFSLRNAGDNRVIIGWVNPFPEARQISIQRSTDSTGFFRTILTVPDAAAIQNGFMDAKAPNDQMFYRLYILLDKGKYLFSVAKKPVKDTAGLVAKPVEKPDTTVVRKTVITKKPVVNTKPAEVIKPPVRPQPDTILAGGKPVVVQARPVVIRVENFQWGDPLAVPNPNHVKPEPMAFMASTHVYTNRDGYVSVSLPENEKSKKYSIKFFEEDGPLLFELKDIKEKDFKIDKANFYHAGWFRFELFENGKLIEKHKIYLEKDF